MLRALVLGYLLILAAPVTAQSVVSPRAFDLIVRWEVGGPRAYAARYTRPICPGNSASGATVGIGYDLGYSSASTILDDWKKSKYKVYLASMAGKTGTIACQLAKANRHIEIPLDLALGVFQDPTLIRYYRITRRSFPAMYLLRPDTQGVLVSLVYNRGGNLVGERRREMRYIAEVCAPRGDDRCVADQLRAMTRLWKGSVIEGGMTNRRHDEARLAETAL